MLASLALGWNYFTLDDPAASQYRIEAVLREDGSALEPENLWRTDRTFDNASVRPVYEDVVHIIDFTESAGDSTYTIVQDTDTPVESQPVGVPIHDDPADNGVAEDTLVGTAVGITALAIDPDQGDIVSYGFANGFQTTDDGLFIHRHFFWRDPRRGRPGFRDYREPRPERRGDLERRL